MRVVIAEDLALLREGLVALLRENDIEVVAQVQDGPSLLRAIAYVESRGDPGAIGGNSDGSLDLCAMQINSQWLPKLARFGITDGSFVEYSADIDYVPAGHNWAGDDWPPEDSLSLWGPDVPDIFLTNTEAPSFKQPA